MYIHCVRLSIESDRGVRETEPQGPEGESTPMRKAGPRLVEETRKKKVLAQQSVPTLKRIAMAIAAGKAYSNAG